MTTLTSVKGHFAYREAPGVPGQSELTLTIPAELALDTVQSRFAAPPADQKRVYTGKLKIAFVKYVTDLRTRKQVSKGEGSFETQATCTMTYPPQANAEMAGILTGRIIDATNGLGLPKNVSGSFRSRVPERTEDPSTFSIQGLSLTFTP